MKQTKAMADYSIKEWIEYIEKHLEEFEIQEFGPDRYNLWRIQITSKSESKLSDYGEDVDKEKAKIKAIKQLAGDLRQYCQ